MFFDTLGKYWESLPTLPYPLVLSTRISEASSYVGYDGSASPTHLAQVGPEMTEAYPVLELWGLEKILGKFLRISTHTIHGTGIFTYMKTIKIDQM